MRTSPAVQRSEELLGLDRKEVKFSDRCPRKRTRNKVPWRSELSTCVELCFGDNKPARIASIHAEGNARNNADVSPTLTSRQHIKWERKIAIVLSGVIAFATRWRIRRHRKPLKLHRTSSRASTAYKDKKGRDHVAKGSESTILRDARKSEQKRQSLTLELRFQRTPTRLFLQKLYSKWPRNMACDNAHASIVSRLSRTCFRIDFTQELTHCITP